MWILVVLNMQVKHKPGLKLFMFDDVEQIRSCEMRPTYVSMQDVTLIMRLCTGRNPSPRKVRELFLTAMKLSFLMPMPRCRRYLPVPRNYEIALLMCHTLQFVIELSPAEGADAAAHGSFDSDED
jgi:hypothetical protein